MSLELSEQELRDFFTENKEKEVGQPGHYETCPIATFFAQKRDLRVAVHNDEIESHESDTSRLLEPWEESFVQRLDYCHRGAPYVLGEEALEILEEVTREGETHETLC